MIKPSFRYMVESRLKGKNFLYEYYFKGYHTLDVGCGNGEFVRLDPALIEGVDLNDEVVKELVKEGLKVKNGDVSRMEFESGAFERVHCRNVIEHLYPEAAYKMLKESARALAPGGLLVLGTEVLTKKFWGTFGHTKPYPPGAIRKLLRSATREEFESISELEYIETIYLGHYSKVKALYLLSSFLAYYTPLSRREYFMILKKR